MHYEITQDQIDVAYQETLKEWTRMKEDFDGSYVLFAISHDAIQFLAQFEMIRRQVIGLGFSMPRLDEKISVSLTDEDEGLTNEM